MQPLTPPQPGPPPDPPNGLFSAKVDAKGRLAVPSEFQEYLTKLHAKRLFVTSLDRTTARIYTMPVWMETKRRLLATTGPTKKAAKDVLFMANLMGEDMEIDSTGRLLLPTNLRRDLGMENAQVWLDAADGYLNVYNQTYFAARKESVAENYEDKLEAVSDLL